MAAILLGMSAKLTPIVIARRPRPGSKARARARARQPCLKPVVPGVTKAARRLVGFGPPGGGGVAIAVVRFFGFTDGLVRFRVVVGDGVAEGRQERLKMAENGRNWLK